MPGQRVLVVDDYQDSREAYAEYLRFVGYEVSSAADGNAALDCALAQSCDVIVLDIALPKLDGLSVLRRLRANPRTADVPVIIVSAATSAEIRSAADAAGANMFLAKPCPPDEVELAIRAVIGA
jgi:two-component system cell cycle response regulator DivK